MYRILFLITLLFIGGTSSAGNLDRYAKALDWKTKWHKVISRQAEKYVENIKRSELSQLSESKQKQITDNLRQSINESISWHNVGRSFIQNFVDNCGTDLLDKIVRYKKGGDITAAERKQVAKAYESCGKNAMDESLGLIYNAFSKLPDTAGERFNKAIADIVIIRKDALKSFRNKYLSAKGHKAFAQSDSGNWNWRSNRTSEEHAINNALASCRARNLKFENWQPCKIINLNEKWTDVYHQLFVRVPKGESDIMSKKALKAFRQKYMAVSKDKAFAQSANGAWSWRSSQVSVDDAMEKTLAACQKNNKKHEAHFPCRIINANNKWRGD